jgi:hypothetical protein
MRAAVLVLVLVIGVPIAYEEGVSDVAAAAPVTIKVFRSHKRGSPIRARVETWRFTTYVGAVMESGAWPRRPRQSGIVGAAAIHQYARWMQLHHQSGYSWRGQRYDIRDGDQYLERHWRPWHAITDRTRSVVREAWPIRLYKNGRYFRTGWRGGAGHDRWHLFEDTVTRLARRGWHWRRIIHAQLDPVTIRT